MIENKALFSLNPLVQPTEEALGGSTQSLHQNIIHNRRTSEFVVLSGDYIAPAPSGIALSQSGHELVKLPVVQIPDRDLLCWREVCTRLWICESL